jgi:flagellar export protein FliJ
MAFRYSLQVLLRLRESLERQRENGLLAAAAQVARLRGEIQQLHDQQFIVRRAELNELEMGTPAAILQLGVTRAIAASSIQKKLEIELAAAERQRLVELAAYHAARQKREILQGLRKRQEAAFQLESSHREQQAMDDLFLIKSQTVSDE